METFTVTDPSRTEAENEDAARSGDRVAVLVDGAGIPRAWRAGCHHSVAWFARSLADALLTALGDASASPRAALATALTQVRELHAGTCDLERGAPSATVVAVRETSDVLEHLVLCDSSLLLLRHGGGPVSRITDDRLARVVAEERTAAAIEARRNRPGGFWVARHELHAAEEALVGAEPLEDLRGAVLVSDGITRAVDELGLLDDSALAERCATRAGALEVLARMRVLERERAEAGTLGLRKVHDDATVTGCSFGTRAVTPS